MVIFLNNSLERCNEVNPIWSTNPWDEGWTTKGHHIWSLPRVVCLWFLFNGVRICVLKMIYKYFIWKNVAPPRKTDALRATSLQQLVYLVPRGAVVGGSTVFRSVSQITMMSLSNRWRNLVLQSTPSPALRTPRYYGQTQNPRRSYRRLTERKIPLLRTLATTDLRSLEWFGPNVTILFSLSL